MVDNKNWHVERGVPVAAIMTCLFLFLGQWTTAAWYISKLDTRIETVEHQITVSAPQGDRLTRVEVKMDSALESIKDIQHTLNVAIQGVPVIREK